MFGMSMQSLYRSPKHGDEWTRADLDSFNIHVTPQDIDTFFGIPFIPKAQVPAEILEIQEADGMANEDNAMLIDLLDVAMVPPTGTKPGESAVIDFTVQLFRCLGGYVGRHRYARTRRCLALPICQFTKEAAIDLCIVDSSNDHIVLLVQEDKRQVYPSDAEAKLIAKAIAAFLHNNECRKANGLPEFQEKLMAGIVMTGTMPTFYKIPITADLVYRVRHGLVNPQPAQVSVFHVPIARQNRRWSEGMKPLDNRRTILGCYEAFKTMHCKDELA